jgi:hypothetical protein
MQRSKQRSKHKPGAKARRRNPRVESNSAAIERAAQLFRGFREDEPGKVSTVKFQVPRAAALIGDIDAIAFRTHHGGKLVKYLHEFTARARPQLLASSDGTMLLILGGNFTFTERGIVDGNRSAR